MLVRRPIYEQIPCAPATGITLAVFVRQLTSVAKRTPRFTDPVPRLKPDPGSTWHAAAVVVAPYGRGVPAGHCWDRPRAGTSVAGGEALS